MWHFIFFSSCVISVYRLCVWAIDGGENCFYPRSSHVFLSYLKCQQILMTTVSLFLNSLFLSQLLGQRVVQERPSAISTDVTPSVVTVHSYQLPASALLTLRFQKRHVFRWIHISHHARICVLYRVHATAVYCVFWETTCIAQRLNTYLITR